ncbi:MAG: polyhydroxyalkanoic acid system family protein [Caulobacter sp.]|nr:polyhydroxyalkanoic acid system family protein [Caulobacter sp.]
MTKPLTLVIPHQLGVAGARARIESGFADLAGKLPGGMATVDQTWDGDRMRFSAQIAGQTITGTLDVLVDMVRMEIVLPGVLGLLAGKIGGKLKDEGQLLLK